MGNWIISHTINDSGNVQIKLIDDMTSRNGSLVELVLERMDNTIYAFIQWGYDEISENSTFPVWFKFGHEAPQKGDWCLGTIPARTHFPGDAVDFICKLTQVDTFEAWIYAGYGDQCHACFDVKGLNPELHWLGIACV